MGKRSGVIDHEDGLAKLTLAELDAEIRRCKLRLQFARSQQLRKAFEKRVHWLERFRQEHHES
jgi:hypothetical protein